MAQMLKSFIKDKPVLFVLMLAFVLRLLAAIFSQGYGMHDDHFLVIEAPYSWTEGKDYENWMPWSQKGTHVASGHSLFYPGVNYLLILAMKSAGITDPKDMMLIIRLLLGLFSLITVYCGYKIVEKLADKERALQTGILLAVIWFAPLLSVRNLVEVIVIPFFAYGFWLIIKEDGPKPRLLPFLIAGIITGIGISVRFQALILVGGTGLALLASKRIIPAIIYGVGVVLSLIALQGGIDYFVWGEPFTEFFEYVRYNLVSKDAYGTDNVWMYIELVPGILIPPVSIFLILGFFKVWRKHLIIFLPVFLFLVFHTFFSNRQERFILPILPFIVILGVIGWNEISVQWNFFINRPKLIKGSFIFFWVINILLLIPITISSTKKSRIDAMHYFYDKRDKVNSILIDDIGRHRSIMLPVFYSGKTIYTVSLSNDIPNDTSQYKEENPYSYIIPAQSMDVYNILDFVELPQYIIFVEDIDLKNRIDHMRSYFPNLQYVHEIPPSILDKVMKKLNPANKNETFYIYKTGLPLGFKKKIKVIGEKT